MAAAEAAAAKRMRATARREICPTPPIAHRHPRLRPVSCGRNAHCTVEQSQSSMCATPQNSRTMAVGRPSLVPLSHSAFSVLPD